MAPAFLGGASTAVFAFPSADCHGPDVCRSCGVHEGHHEAQQPGGSRERERALQITRAGYGDGEKILVHPLGDWQSRWNDPVTTCHFHSRLPPPLARTPRTCARSQCSTRNCPQHGLHQRLVRSNPVAATGPRPQRNDLCGDPAARTNVKPSRAPDVL